MNKPLKVGDYIKHVFGWGKVVKVISQYVYECVWVSDEEKEADPQEDRICAHTGGW